MQHDRLHTFSNPALIDSDHECANSCFDVRMAGRVDAVAHAIDSRDLQRPCGILIPARMPPPRMRMTRTRVDQRARPRGVPLRHASEQNFTLAQSRAHFFRQAKSRPQTGQRLVGRSAFAGMGVGRPGLRPCAGNRP